MWVVRFRFGANTLITRSPRPCSFRHRGVDAHPIVLARNHFMIGIADEPRALIRGVLDRDTEVSTVASSGRRRAKRIVMFGA